MSSKSNLPENSVLYLHIGHGKTGSSALQAYLAQNCQSLLDSRGVQYPYHKSFQRAEKGYISTGNVSLLLDNDYRPPAGISLYSSEILFNSLNKSRLSELFEIFGYNFKVFCYTRDLFDFLASAWGQKVKRNGYTEIIDAFILSSKFDYLRKLNCWLDWADELGFEFRVFNYSRHHNYLCVHFLSELLGESGRKFVEAYPPRFPRVNRSLTLAEYEIQRQFNRFFNGDNHQFVSDPWVNELPDIIAERPELEEKSYAHAIACTREITAHINTRIPRSEEIRLDSSNGFSSTHRKEKTSIPYAFSEAQIETLVRSLSKHLMPINNERLLRILEHHFNNIPLHKADIHAFQNELFKRKTTENETGSCW